MDPYTANMVRGIIVATPLQARVLWGWPFTYITTEMHVHHSALSEALKSYDGELPEKFKPLRQSLITGVYWDLDDLFCEVIRCIDGRVYIQGGGILGYKIPVPHPAFTEYYNELLGEDWKFAQKVAELFLSSYRSKCRVERINRRMPT